MITDNTQTETEKLTEEAIRIMGKLKKHPIKSTLLTLGWLTWTVTCSIWKSSSVATKCTIIFSIIGLTIIAL